MYIILKRKKEIIITSQYSIIHFIGYFFLCQGCERYTVNDFGIKIFLRKKIIYRIYKFVSLFLIIKYVIHVRMYIYSYFIIYLNYENMMS